MSLPPGDWRSVHTIPDDEKSVPPAGCKPSVVGREGDTAIAFRVTLEDLRGPTRDWVPHRDDGAGIAKQERQCRTNVVALNDGEAGAVGVVCCVTNNAGGVIRKDYEFLIRAGVPKLDGVVPGTRRQSTIRRKLDCIHRAGMAAKGPHESPFDDIPDLDRRSEFIAARDQAAVGANCHVARITLYRRGEHFLTGHYFGNSKGAASPNIPFAHGHQVVVVLPAHVGMAAEVANHGSVVGIAQLQNEFVRPHQSGERLNQEYVFVVRHECGDGDCFLGPYHAARLSIKYFQFFPSGGGQPGAIGLEIESFHLMPKATYVAQLQAGGDLPKANAAGTVAERDNHAIGTDGASRATRISLQEGRRRFQLALWAVLLPDPTPAHRTIHKWKQPPCVFHRG